MAQLTSLHWWSCQQTCITLRAASFLIASTCIYWLFYLWSIFIFKRDKWWYSLIILKKYYKSPFDSKQQKRGWHILSTFHSLTSVKRSPGSTPALKVNISKCSPCVHIDIAMHQYGHRILQHMCRCQVHCALYLKYINKYSTCLQNKSIPLKTLLQGHW